MSFDDYKTDVADNFFTQVSERTASDIMGSLDGVEVNFDISIEDVDTFLDYLGITESNYTEHPIDKLDEELDSQYQYETSFKNIGLKATPTIACL